MSRYQCSARRYPGIFLLIIFCFVKANSYASSSDNTQPTKTLLEVAINQHRVSSDAYLFLDFNHQLYAKAADLKHWKIKLPSTTPLLYQNEYYCPLHDIAGLTYKIDDAKMQLHMTVPAADFAETVWVAETPQIHVNYPANPGGFVNYDVSVSKLSQTTLANGTIETAYFNSHGVGDNTFLLHKNIQTNPTNNYNDDTPTEKIVRLNTSWTYDIPEKMCTLKLGDTISTNSMWGRSVNYGGIQWGTNFSTQPTFIKNPVPSIHGEAVVPSSVDLYVNNALTNQRNIQPGPFEISNIPVVNGQGMMSVVTTDLLGRQQISTIPYYMSTDLLKPGLHDYAIEAGFIRRNFTQDSTNYGRFMAVGTDRVGITDHLTTEKRLELVQNQQTIGYGATYLLGLIGQTTAAMAASHSTKGAGSLFSLGFQRSTLNFNFSAQAQVTSPHFTQLGFDQDEVPPKLQSLVALGYTAQHIGSFGISYTTQFNRDKTNSRFLALSYNYSLHGWAILASILKNLSDGSHPSFFVTLNHTFGDRNYINLNTTHQSSNTLNSVRLTRPLPSDTGFGYNLQLEQGNNPTQQGELDYQSTYANYSFLAATQQGQNSYQLNTNGGLAILGGHSYFLRTITNSFGVAKVGHYPNVKVYADNQVVGRTDSTGTALIPYLSAYDVNKIGIDINDLPITAEVAEKDQYIIPYYRSGVLISFNTKEEHGAQMKLILPNGKPIPAGATVTLIGDKNAISFPVLANGSVYISGLNVEKSNLLKANWPNHQCQFKIDYPKGNELIPDLGTVTCQ